MGAAPLRSVAASREPLSSALTGKTKLRVGVRETGLDRLRADKQLLGDLGVRASPDRQQPDPQLAGGERVGTGLRDAAGLGARSPQLVRGAADQPRRPTAVGEIHAAREEEAPIGGPGRRRRSAGRGRPRGEECQFTGTPCLV